MLRWQPNREITAQMNLPGLWRLWRRTKELKRLRARHGEVAGKLKPGAWIAGPADAHDEKGDIELAGKLKKIGAAFREARQHNPPRRGRR